MINSLSVFNGRASWGGGDELNCPIETISNTTRYDVTGYNYFFAFYSSQTTNGSPIVGKMKISMKFYSNNTTYWVKTSVTSNGGYTHPTNRFGEVMNDSMLVSANLQTTEVVNYVMGRYYTTQTPLVSKAYYALKVDQILNLVGLDSDDMEPERVDITYYYREKDTDEWTTSNDTLYFYGQDIAYPKFTYTYTGTGLINNKYYDNKSTMTLTVTVTDSVINGSKINGLTEKVTVYAGTTVPIIYQFEPDDFDNAIATNTFTFTLTTFKEVIQIEANNGFTYKYDSFEINNFEYLPPKCFESNCYRTGTEDEIKLDAIGTYQDETEFPITFKYQWRLQGGTWSNWTTIATVQPGVIGPIEAEITFDSPLSDGDVQVQLSISDTIETNTYVIYVGGPAIFSWSGEDFKFTAPVYINTNETPITINGVSLDDYIRGIQ